MIELTDAARRCLDGYLAEVRLSLRHCASVDVAEVERDVEEHIEHALAGAHVAVDTAELQAVLRKLGSPSRWVPQEELGLLQRALLALRSGPEDLRLGYLSFVMLALTLFLAACLNLELHVTGVLPFLLVGLALSFVLARASLSAIAEPRGPEKWLIYPSLLAVYVPLTVLMLLWPLAVAVTTEVLLTDAGGFHEIVAWARQYPLGTITAFTCVMLGSLSLAFLGFIAWRWPEVIRDCYAPFAGGFRRHGTLLFVSLASLLAFLTCMAVALGAITGKTPSL